MKNYQIKMFIKKNYPILTILLVGFIIGLIVLNNYGESWDDYSLQKYAKLSLETYVRWNTDGIMPITAEDLGNYGPSYVMAISLGSRLIGNLLPISPPDNRHILYFITYLGGILAFYDLSKRWLSSTASIYATLLYITQPLFWGHAFMNPKDLPFTTFFLCSVLLGFRLIDRIKDDHQAPLPKWLSMAAILGTIGLFGLYASAPLVREWIETLVRSAAAGATNIVSIMASDLHKVNPEVYIQKYFLLHLRMRFIFLVSFLLLLVFLFKRHAPNTLRTYLRILPAAFFLGFTSSMRILGPFAGAIVLLFGIYKHGKRSLNVLIPYGIISLAITYITWPYLWENPIAHLVESFQTMSNYPWFGTVLFNGIEYKATELPLTYLPVLMGIQFTEPVLILFFTGAVMAARKIKENVELTGITILWFIFPLLGFMGMRTALYDNFRQVFFILPPVFFMAGFGIEAILKLLKQPILRAGLAGLIMLPGIAAGIQLHPYQYVYYNSLVNNPNERFELDYWLLSYREATFFINKVAPANANILVAGPGQLVELYIRSDLTVFSDNEKKIEPCQYLISTTRYNLDSRLYPDVEAMYTVERKGMPFAVVKKLPD